MLTYVFFKWLLSKSAKAVAILIILTVYRGTSKYNVHVPMYRWIDTYTMVSNFDS